MRQDNINRLTETSIGIDDLWYLHYEPYHRELFEAFKRHVKGELLDIGCGNKPYKNILAPYITKYTGCDIVQSSNNAVDILCPANDIPVGNGSFDTVISTQTIEHVEDHQGLVNEAYRSLKTGGFFVVSGPMYWPLHEEPYDFFRFTKHGFRFVLEKAGFEITDIRSNGGRWSVAGQAFLHALYPQVYHINGIKGKVIRSLLWIIGGVKTINKFFRYLDNQYLDESNTMNYVVVAHKK